MNRLKLVELIEAEKSKLSSQAREQWDELEASLYLSPEEETRLKPHEVSLTKRMAGLPVTDQNVIRGLMKLRAGLYDSDYAERQGEPGESHRNRAVVHAAMLKDRDEGRQVDLFISLERAIERLEKDV